MRRRPYTQLRQARHLLTQVAHGEAIARRLRGPRVDNVGDACSSGVGGRDDAFDAGEVGGAEDPALAAGDVEAGDVVGELAAVGDE